MGNYSVLWVNLINFKSKGPSGAGKVNFINNFKRVQ